MYKEQKLFVTDLDGTLLDEDKKIPLSAIIAIRKYVNAGNLFTIASGRSETNCRLATDFIPITAPAILYNGACIMDLKTEKILYEKTLDAASFRPMLHRVMNQFPSLCIEISAYGPKILVNPNAEIDNHLIIEKQPFVSQDLDETPEKWLKIMFYAPNEILKTIVHYLEENNLIPTCNRMYSADYYYEFLHPEVSKNNALLWLMNSLQINPENVGAIGDHLNDREMLQNCIHPYAPSNAHEQIKKIANVTTGNNNTGAIAEALADFLRK